MNDPDPTLCFFSLLSHHQCRLGKWFYEGDGRDSFSHLPAYRRLEPVHAQVLEGTHHP